MPPNWKQTPPRLAGGLPEPEILPWEPGGSVPAPGRAGGRGREALGAQVLCEVTPAPSKPDAAEGTGLQGPCPAPGEPGSSSVKRVRTAQPREARGPGARGARAWLIANAHRCGLLPPQRLCRQPLGSPVVPETPCAPDCPVLAPAQPPTHKAVVHDPAQALQRLQVLGEVELHQAGVPEQRHQGGLRRGWDHPQLPRPTRWPLHPHRPVTPPKARPASPAPESVRSLPPPAQLPPTPTPGLAPSRPHSPAAAAG